MHINWLELSAVLFGVKCFVHSHNCLVKVLIFAIIARMLCGNHLNLVLFRDTLLPCPENGPEPRPLFPPGFRPIFSAGQEGVPEQD